MARENQFGQSIKVLQGRLLGVLTDHVGKPNAISAVALYKAVYDQEPNDPITATRCLRELVRDLRMRGKKVCSGSSCTGGGYYLASTRGELKEFCDAFHGRALATLAQEAQMKRIALPELLGQLSMQLWKSGAGHAT